MSPAGEIYDCLIVGGGPAGLSAAIYMGRFLRRTIVLDAADDRSSFAQINDNYLGFPNGVKVQELRELGRQQAQRFGVEFVDCFVDFLAAEKRTFCAKTTKGEFRAKTVILCTGVKDIWPALPDVLEYVGKTLFWCITCDGFRSMDKRIVLFGHNDDAATTACQFINYTKEITFVSAPGQLNCSDRNVIELERHGIRMLEGVPAAVEGTPDKIEAVTLRDGTRLPCDVMFSLLGCRPTNNLALDLGLNVDPEGYVRVDEEGYTSVPGVFCAGDISRMHTHQVVSAAHEGAEAAQTANYYLYAGFQKNEKDV